MKRIMLGAMLILVVLLSACSSLDVVQKDAVRAFDEVLTAYPVAYADGWYQLTSPDGAAKLIYDNGSIGLEADATPFLAAGLDAEKYGELAETIFYPQSLHFMLPGFDMLNQNGKDTASAQFAVNLPHERKYLGYHTAMDHYNLSFPNDDLSISSAAMFEWAKDMDANDKDIVFVLDPAPLIAAGVDPNAIEGWTYAQVSVMVDGKETQVYKFLKPFNIK